MWIDIILIIKDRLYDNLMIITEVGLKIIDLTVLATLLINKNILRTRPAGRHNGGHITSCAVSTLVGLVRIFVVRLQQQKYDATTLCLSGIVFVEPGAKVNSEY